MDDSYFEVTVIHIIENNKNPSSIDKVLQNIKNILKSST